MTDDLEPACWSWSAWTPADLARTKAEYSPSFRTRMDDEAWASLMMSRWHQGRCAICGEHDDLIEDHDHLTGLVRGHLCRSCNIREGVSRGGVWAKYRERNPATICGVRERYWNPVTKEYAEPQPEPEQDPWKYTAMRDVGL